MARYACRPIPPRPEGRGFSGFPVSRERELTGTYPGVVTPDAAYIAAAVWDTLVSDLDTANSIGARLAQAATVPSTGAQIAALGV